MTRLSKAQREKYDMVIGSRRQVFNGTAHHTSGGLTKDKLFMSKNGRIVSKSKHFSAKREKRLVKAGYGTKKGKFGFVLLKGKKGKTSKKGKSSKKRTMKKKGGYSGHLPLSPENYDGAGVGTSGVALQEVAGQAGGYSGHLPLKPENYDGAGVGTSGVALQEEAGQAGGKRRRHKKGGHSNIKAPLSYSDYTQGGGKKRRKSRRRKGGACPDGQPEPCS